MPNDLPTNDMKKAAIATEPQTVTTKAVAVVALSEG